MSFCLCAILYTICLFACVKSTDYWFVPDDIELTVKQIISKCGLKGRDAIAPYLLKKADPAVISQEYGSVVLCLHKNNLHVSTYKGFTFPVTSLAEGLNYVIMMFFLLHIDYPKASPTIFQCLANLHGCHYQVNKTMTDLVASLK